VSTTRYYHQNIGDLKERLRASVDREDLRSLHQIRPSRHFLTTIRLIFCYGVCTYLLYQLDNPMLWIPVAILQAFNILGFIILLHEVTHDLVFKTSHPRMKRLLGWLYSLPSAISSSQFQRWHLDHHDELGSEAADPKRAHLSPKLNHRWLKALYFTPALFVIYAIAAGSAAKEYGQSLRFHILLERIVAISIHVGFAYWLISTGGEHFLKVWAMPLLVFFPPIFLLNRLGQHYSINPKDPAHWSTRVDGNPIWRWLFVNSNHHIEHHYYPRVPHYNLPKLNSLLRPFFEKNSIEDRSYTYLISGWFGKNYVAHSDWNHS